MRLTQIGQVPPPPRRCFLRFVRAEPDAILSALDVFEEVLRVEDKDKQPPDMFTFVAALHPCCRAGCDSIICSYAGELRAARCGAPITGRNPSGNYYPSRGGLSDYK